MHKNERFLKKVLFLCSLCSLFKGIKVYRSRAYCTIDNQSVSSVGRPETDRKPLEDLRKRCLAEMGALLKREGPRARGELSDLKGKALRERIEAGFERDRRKR